MKKGLILVGALTLALTLGSCGEKGLEKLPESINTELQAGGKACSIENGGFTTNCGGIQPTDLVKYLDRNDTVYIDLRGAGAGYHAGHLQGFEMIDFFGYIYNEKKSDQLFYKNEGKMTPNYNESTAIIKNMFPSDKNIFLMCQSGARVAFMMDILHSLDYDMSKVYNVQGWNQLSKVAELKPLQVLGNGATPEVKYTWKGLTPIK